MDFTTGIDLSKCDADRSIYLLCYKMYNTHEEINDKLRFNTLTYCVENPDFCLKLFEDNKDKDDIISLISITNNFIQNVSKNRFIELFGENVTTCNYSLRYLEEKYYDMKNHTSYFISTRDKLNYDKIINCVLKYWDVISKN